MVKRIAQTTRRTFWTAAAFYALIAFEFFYMASPFAAYFYSVYRPSLNLLGDVPLLSGLTGFFLPHIVSGLSLFPSQDSPNSSATQPSASSPSLARVGLPSASHPAIW